MSALSNADIQAVLADVSYPGFSFEIVGVDRAEVKLQIVCEGTDNVTGEPMTWKSRKWLLSRHMTRGEVVQTAFKAVMTAIEHETRELFTYRGAAVFDPHYDIDKLVDLRRQPDALVERGLSPEQIAGDGRMVLGQRTEDRPAMVVVEGADAGPHASEFPQAGNCADWDPQP